MSDLLVDNRRGAYPEGDGERRYKLWRRGGYDGPVLAFVMLNPSTANEQEDDNTMRRCIAWADQWGYGKVLVGNLFGLRAKEPDDLYDHPDPVGPENDDCLREIIDEADRVVAAWGVHGEYQGRGREVVSKFDADWHAVGTTKEGHPWHPLFKPADVEPEPFTYVADAGGEAE